MARSWQYPRWRRTAMQAVLALILAGTIGLAELVTRQRDHTLVPTLGQTRTLDNRLKVQLPADWSIEQPDAKTLIARQGGSGEGGRTLKIRLQQIDGIASSQDYLDRTGLLNSPVSGNQEEDTDDLVNNITQGPQLRPIIVAGWPGLMGRVIRMAPSETGEPMIHESIVAIAVLPPQTAIIMQLDSPDAGVEDSNSILVKQIAAAMDLPGMSPLRNQSTVSLPNGLTLKVPPGYAVLPQPDHNRTNSAIFFDGPDGRRLLIGLVPCIYFPNDPPEDIRTMLQMHDPSLARVNLSQQDGIWRTDGDGTPHVSGARVIVRPDGNSVLVICSGEPVDSDDFKSAFDVLSNNITQAQTPNYGEMLDAGRALAGRFNKQFSSDPPVAVVKNQWWLLREIHGNLVNGWVHIHPDTKSPGDGLLELRMRIDNHVYRITQSWSADQQARTYQFAMNQSETQGTDADAQLAPIVGQFTLLVNDMLHTRVKMQSSETESPESAPPAAYVPSGWLVSAISQADRPMILRSEAIPGPLFGSVTQPLKLLITPIPASDTTALRCTTVEISGTGMIERYYFRSDNAPDHIEYPDNVQQIHTAQANITHRFADDPRMLP